MEWLEEWFYYGIIDVDGTLLDSIPFFRKRRAEFEKKLGIFGSIFQEIFSPSRLDSLDYYLGNFGSLIKKFIWKKLLKMQDENSLPFPYATDLLKNLSKKSIILFVSSGSFYPRERLKGVCLDKYFYQMFGAENGCKEKHIKQITDMLQVPFQFFKRHTFYIGDSLREMVIAKKHGIYAIGIAGLYSKEALLRAGANMVVEKIEDLLK